MDGDSSEAPEVSPYSEHWTRDEGTSGFWIVIDPARQFMHVVLWGEWRNAQTNGLVVAHAKAVAAMKKAGARHGEFLTLVDMREKLMSAGEVVAEFERSFAGNSPSLRSAIVVSSALPTTIGAQIAPSDRVLITYTLEQALAWLFPHGDLPASIADLRL